MGRPISKKYFGNRNETGLGGEGVASIVAGGTNNNYTTKPAITVAAPTMPGGVTALASVSLMGASSAAPANTGTGGSYDIGDVLTLAGGTGTAPTFDVSSIVARSVTLVPGQGGANYVADNIITFTGAGWTTDLVLRVLTVDGDAIATFEVVIAGVRDTTLANPLTGGTVTSGSQQTGTGAKFNVDWGVAGVTLATPGALSVLPANPAATTVSPEGGTGATLNVAYNIREIAVTEPGSGYVTASNLITTNPVGNATFTTTLTNTNENAIQFVAWVPTDKGGTSAVAGDIVRQVSARRFLVTTAQGTGICRLVTSAPAAGEMRITALDSAGGTYYVSKISSRRVTVVPGTGTQFASGVTVPWTLAPAVLNETVQLSNA